MSKKVIRKVISSVNKTLLSFEIGEARDFTMSVMNKESVRTIASRIKKTGMAEFRINVIDKKKYRITRIK